MAIRLRPTNGVRAFASSRSEAAVGAAISSAFMLLHTRESPGGTRHMRVITSALSYANAEAESDVSKTRTYDGREADAVFAIEFEVGP